MDFRLNLNVLQLFEEEKIIKANEFSKIFNTSYFVIRLKKKPKNNV